MREVKSQPRAGTNLLVSDLSRQLPNHATALIDHDALGAKKIDIRVLAEAVDLLSEPIGMSDIVMVHPCKKGSLRKLDSLVQSS